MIARLRGRSATELRSRARQAARAWLERTPWSAAGTELTDARFDRLITPSFAARPAGHLARFREAPPALFPAFANLGGTAAAVREHWPDAAADAVRRADATSIGSFDLLGHCGLSFGTPIDWHLDPLAQIRAPRRHWSRVPYLDYRIVGDHKVIWELNRQQHLITLGQAYQLTRDERYAGSVVAHMTEWMDANPPSIGINWASSLEIAFRAISWIWAMRLVAESPALGDTFYRRALGMLYAHATHLMAYMSTYFSPNTHLTGEALGLVYLGTQLEMFSAASVWYARGCDVLLTERARQIRPDGTYFEQATYYHRYTADFYLQLLLLTRQRDPLVAAGATDVLHGLLDFLVAITRPDGTSPLIGDEDGGRVVPLASRAADDFRDTVALGGVLLDRPDCCFAAARAPVELAWLLGPTTAGDFERVGRAEPPRAAAFRGGGYFVMRDAWTADANYLIAECGPHGGLSGGHAHADVLSIEVCAAGSTIIADPGTYTYTAEPEMRDRLRDSAMHNTVTLDGQSSAVPDGPFRWRHKAQGTVTTWTAAPRFTYLSGSHDGYTRLDPPARHSREVLFIHESLWAVRDRIESSADRPFMAHFHGAAGVSLARLDLRTALWSAPNGSRLLLAVSPGGELSDSPSIASPTYGVLQAVTACDCRVARGSGGELFTIMVPIPPASVMPQIETTMGGALVRSEHSMQEVLVGENHASDARLTWIRRDGAGRATEFVAIEGTRLTIEGENAVAEGGGFTSASGRWTGSRWVTEVTPVPVT